jgi:hypothetical protein
MSDYPVIGTQYTLSEAKNFKGNEASFEYNAETGVASISNFTKSESVKDAKGKVVGKVFQAFMNKINLVDFPANQHEATAELALKMVAQRPLRSGIDAGFVAIDEAGTEIEVNYIELLEREPAKRDGSAMRKAYAITKEIEKLSADYAAGEIDGTEFAERVMAKQKELAEAEAARKAQESEEVEEDFEE